MKKKILSTVLAAAMIASLALTGCGSSSEGTEDSEGGKTTITFMNHTSESRSISYEDSLIEEFEKENPDIDVEVQRMSMDDYTQTIQTKFASGDAPDVFYIEQSNLEDYAKNGYLLDLTDTDIADHYDGNMLQYDGKSYGAPVGVTAYVVTYNKKVFQDLGLDVPTTLDEFYNVCDKIKDAGITPMAAGYQDSWVLMADAQSEYANSILINDADALKKLESREVKFAESDEWKDVFTRFSKRISYEQDDQFGTDWNTACTMLANGEAAMIVSGDWTSNNVADMGDDVELGAFILPVSNTAADNKVAIPGAGQSFAISADSKNQEAAEKFVSYMTTADAGEKYVEDSIGICVIKGVKAPESESALGDIVQAMNDGKSVMMGADYDANFSEEFRDAFQNTVSDFVLNGGDDVDGLLKNLDTEFDRIAGSN